MCAIISYRMEIFQISIKKGKTTMKKFLAILLSALLVSAIIAVPVSALSQGESTTLSVGKSYTTTAPNRKDGWDDDGKKLTDGVIADVETAELEPVTSAWNNPGKNANLPNVVEIIVDLEEAVLSNSYTIYLAGGTWGISAPTAAGSATSIEVFAADSKDGAYTSVASAPAEDVVLLEGTGADGSWSTYSLTAKAATPVEARFIKFVITVQPVGNAFVWANEVEVNAVNIDVSEPDVSEPDVSEPDSSEPEASTPDASTPDVSDSETSDKEDTKPGDASNMIIFAIIALVAMAGSAVVIKTRK